MRARNWKSFVLAATLAVALVAVGCSSDDDAESTTTAPTTTEAADTTEAEEPEAETLTILVSNDDGYDAPGLDALVRALTELPDTEVVVVTPDSERSATGGTTLDGEQTITDQETQSGYPAKATDGFPADAVNWALDGGIDVTPDLVITGINSGQNLGAIGDQLSGTIGAARAGAANGIVSLATSTAISEQADYDLAATYVVDWVQENREAILAGEFSDEQVTVFSLNVPVCTEGELRGVVEVPMSPISDGAIADQDCTSTLEDPADDIAAFNNGFVSLAEISLEPAPAP